MRGTHSKAVYRQQPLDHALSAQKYSPAFNHKLVMPISATFTRGVFITERLGKMDA